MEVISNPGVEEIHTCLLCKGINRDTKKENKEAKTLKYNICITRNHYANCLNETEEGRIFFESTHMTGLDPNQPVKIKCEDPRCKVNKRFRDGFTSHKMFYNHMALFHGGLETWMRGQERQDIKDLVSKLPCHKLPVVCFVFTTMGSTAKEKHCLSLFLTNYLGQIGQLNKVDKKIMVF